MRLCRLAAVAAVALLLPACALKTPPDANAIKAESMAKVGVPVTWKAVPPVAGIVTDNWLATFQDDPLTAAVVEAIASNPDMAVGAARVEQAQLYAKLAGAKLYPSVDVVAKGGAKGGDASALQGAWLLMSWELDLWGRVRYGRAAAAADAMSSAADYEYARQSLAALVAKSWFLATEATLQAELARKTIADQEALVRLAESRVQIGVGNSEDVYVARASVAGYEDALRQIELARTNAIRALELLIGHYPAAIATIENTLPAQPPPVPAGLPSELLERRPDVVAAERRVAAAFNRVGEAKAARLPAIALTAGASGISSDLVVLKEHSNPVWSLGANLLAPIYHGGALKTNVEIKSAAQKEAIAAYASIGLRAFGEVESALAAEFAARDREQILARGLADTQRAFDIVQTQYRVGSTDMRYVTQRQLAVNATQAALIRMQAEQRVQRVNLHLALGGSFEQRPH
jgi:NodT family efflux transporter outer membrane factor (OMF) lipoprotein